MLNLRMGSKAEVRPGSLKRCPALPALAFVRTRTSLWTLALLLTIVLSQHLSAQSEVVPFQNYVNDHAGIVPDDVEQKLNMLLKRLEERTEAQIAVVVVRSTGGVPVADYAVEFGQKWGVGKKEKDNGVIFVVATEDRSMYIAAGYGVEEILPDGKVGRIADQAVIPFFRKGEMVNGIVNGTLVLAREIAGAAGLSLDDLAAAEFPPPRSGSGRGLGRGLPLLLFLFLPLLFRGGLFGLLPFFLMGHGMRGGHFGGGFGSGGFGGGFHGGLGGGFGGGGAGRSW